MRSRSERQTLPLSVLLQREVANEKIDQPEIVHGQASQSKKGEDFTLLKTDCQRAAGDGITTYSVFAVCIYLILRGQRNQLICFSYIPSSILCHFQFVFFPLWLIDRVLFQLSDVECYVHFGHWCLDVGMIWELDRFWQNVGNGLRGICRHDCPYGWQRDKVLWEIILWYL